MKHLLIAALMASLNFLHAQNLIPNADFEYTYPKRNPRFAGSIAQAEPWFPAGIGSPDLISPTEPYFGKQAAASGVRYAGIILYDADNPEFREYLEVRLIQTLNAGETYCLRFKISAADESWAYTDELGLLLSADSVRSPDWNRIDRNPQFKTPKYQPISDTAAWQEIQFRFQAQGNERFLTIGNFRSDASTLLRPARRDVRIRIAYVYLDQFYLGSCVEKQPEPQVPDAASQLREETQTGGPPIFPSLLSPNGDGFNDVFRILNLPRYCELKIMNRVGAVIYRNSNYANDFNGENLPEGKYDYELKYPEGNVFYGSFELSRKKTKSLK